MNKNNTDIDISKEILNKYGWQQSLIKNLPIDKNGNPYPLYTYPAIEYLNSIDFKGKRIFEFGLGYSTFYWINQGAKVISVEHNQNWINQLSVLLKDKESYKYLFCPEAQDYINSILDFTDHYFDLIIIDGKYSRFLCAKNALKKVKEDGLIILDNSDWYPNTAKLIRDNLDFIEIDFYGIRPSKIDTSITSLFLSRKCNLKTKLSRQPNYAIGGKQKHSKLDSDIF